MRRTAFHRQFPGATAIVRPELLIWAGQSVALSKRIWIYENIPRSSPTGEEVQSPIKNAQREIHLK
jgi:hypothetical protein